MTKSVEITENDAIAKDELWCWWYRCPHCKGNNIAEDFNYCPDCGVKLEWKK